MLSSDPGFRTVPCGLTIDGEPVRARWSEFGRLLAASLSSSLWILGDWIIHGERSYGSVYTEAEELTGLEYGYLRNVRRVCARFELSRRRDNLSFSHHDAVSALPPAEADTLLLRVATEGLSLRALRAIISTPHAHPEVDPFAVQLSTAQRAATQLRDSIERLLASEQAERLKRHLARHHADPAAVLAALSDFAAESATGFEPDAADADDLAPGHFGRRVG